MFDVNHTVSSTARAISILKLPCGQLRGRAIRDKKRANRNRFPTGVYYRELIHTLNNIKMTFKLDAQAGRHIGQSLHTLGDGSDRPRLAFNILIDSMKAHSQKMVEK